jgi:hypothetical protein
MIKMHEPVHYWVNEQPMTGKVTAIISNGDRYMIDFKHLVHRTNLIPIADLKPTKSTSVSFRRNLRPLVTRN